MPTTAVWRAPIEHFCVAYSTACQIARSAVARAEAAVTSGKIGKSVYAGAYEEPPIEQTIEVDPQRTVLLEIPIAAPQCPLMSGMLVSMRDDR